MIDGQGPNHSNFGWTYPSALLFGIAHTTRIKLDSTALKYYRILGK